MHRPWQSSGLPACNGVAGTAHDWTAWRTVKQGAVYGESLLFGGRPMGWWLLQERQCQVCGFTERHKQITR